MKTKILRIAILFVFCCCYLLVFSQDPDKQKFEPNQPISFAPKSHDSNFLKSAKLSEKSFYQSKSEWQHIIDTTWGPGDPLSRKLEIFNTYAQAIHDESDVLCFLNLNWDSLYNHYLTQITESTSRGAFSSIMSHFAYELKDYSTWAADRYVIFSELNPGVPILLIGSIMPVEHFGAVTTVLPDSTTLVLRVTPNHPLDLEPGDIILGYEGVPWKNLVRELLDAGLPMWAKTGGCPSADNYQNLSGAGLNWHLFSSIDILKYSSGDTLHLPVLPMLNLNVAHMINNEQLAIENIPFPKPNLLEPSDKLVTYGILENTNIGYVFLSGEWPMNVADEQFYEAIDSLKNTDALVIDMRFNFGGGTFLDKTWDFLFNESHKALEYNIRCNTNTFDLCPVDQFPIDGKNPDYYDKPISVLLGPSCASMGDIIAQMFRFHPMVKFFGASSFASLGSVMKIGNIPGWELYFSTADFHISEPGVYLNRKEFPIDYPVWFNKDDVAKGIDPIVEKSLDWINNLAYGHSIKTGESAFSPEGDTVVVNATIENPNSHELSAKIIIESMDGSFIDSTDMTKTVLLNGATWQAKWIAPVTSENTFWISVKVTDYTDGTSFINKHMTQITNRTIEIDKLTYTKSSEYKYSIKTELKNPSEINYLSSPAIQYSSDDPWVKLITPEQGTFPGIKPGATVRTPSFSVSVDETTFLGDINLTYTISENGWPFWVIDTTITIISTGLDQAQSEHLAFSLDQNYPNPFHSVTTISFTLKEKADVKISVLNSIGKVVAIIVNEEKESGNHEIEFNAGNLPRGVYFYQLKAGEFIQTRKMVLME